jgi:purine-binding chemotaxis protein CheW
LNELQARNGTASAAETQLVTARIGRQLFGFPILDIQDIVEVKNLTDVPLASTAIAGVMNLRGRIVTVIDLRRCLGEAPSDATGRRMGVTVNHRGDLYTLLVDEVGDVGSFADDDYGPPPATLDDHLRPICSGIYRLPHELLAVLDVARILDPDLLARAPAKSAPPEIADAGPAVADIATPALVEAAAPEPPPEPEPVPPAEMDVPDHVETAAEALPEETEDTEDILGWFDESDPEDAAPSVSPLLQAAQPFEDADLGIMIDIEAGGGVNYAGIGASEPEQTEPEMAEQDEARPEEQGGRKRHCPNRISSIRR